MRPGARFVVAAAALTAATFSAAARAAAPPPTATPTPAAHNPQENPEDVRARLPRPTPMDTETKFPPPQQAPDEEARTANAPSEETLLPGERPVLLDGQPFPERRPYDPGFPRERRTRFVSIEAEGPGDGSLERPWKDLQQALCALEPGDRLVVASGIYTGSFRVAGTCRSGTKEAPIQVFARHAFLKSGGGDVLTLERAHWQFWELQIALLDSKVAGLTTRGPDAHDIAIDQTHVYEGNGPAVVIGGGSSRITVSNCHIHQSMGVRIEPGASNVTLVNNHIHHNRAASVTVGDSATGSSTAGGSATGSPGAAAPREIVITGNRIHNDRGPALDLAGCDGVAADRNRFSNYRPDEDDGAGGEAVRVGACRNVTFENNSVLEASVAVRIGGPQDGTKAPEAVAFSRNYLQNKLTGDSTAFAVDAGRTIRLTNNVIDHYAEAFRISPGVRGLTVANNLVLSPKTAFSLGSRESVALFDYNVFSVDGSFSAVVAGASVDPAWMTRQMPRSRSAAEVGIVDGDLAKVRGFQPIDSGKAVDRTPFRGSAPDVGVAEH